MASGQQAAVGRGSRSAYPLIKRALLCALFSVSLAAIPNAAWWLIARGDSASAQTIEIVVPPGTSELIAQGLSPAIFPPDVSYSPGSTLRIRNNDVVVHEVGPVYIEPGEIRSIPLSSVQTSQGKFVCTFHAGGYLNLNPSGSQSGSIPIVPTLLLGLPISAVLFGVVSLVNRMIL